MDPLRQVFEALRIQLKQEGFQEQGFAYLAPQGGDPRTSHAGIVVKWFPLGRLGSLEHRLLLSWNAEDVVISCESSGNHIVCPWTEQTAFKASREWLEALKR